MDSVEPTQEAHLAVKVAKHMGKITVRAAACIGIIGLALILLTLLLILMKVHQDPSVLSIEFVAISLVLVPSVVVLGIVENVSQVDNICLIAIGCLVLYIGTYTAAVHFARHIYPPVVVVNKSKDAELPSALSAAAAEKEESPVQNVASS